MLRSLIILTLFLIVSSLELPAAGTTTRDDTPPRRVILHVDRNQVIKGKVELEEDNLIVVRDRAGELHSYTKSKISAIVRLVDPGPDQLGLIVLANGQTQEGVIIEDTFEVVVFEIQGIRTSIRRDLVNYVLLEPTVLERYQLFRDQLAPGMHTQHLQLCQWLFDHKQYELCRTELLELMEQSTLPDARRLLRIVDAQLMLLDREAATNPADGDAAPDDAASGDDERKTGIVPPSELMPDVLLTHEDVNLIRVMEIDFQTPPRLRIRPDTVRTLIETYRDDDRVPLTPDGQTKLFRDAADHPLRVLRLIFDLRARELYGEVEVLSEPKALNLFRQRIHNSWLINSCATTRCHGGLGAGRFFLHRRGYKDERVRYTNLLILDRIKLDDQWPMINYHEPRESLLIQHAMSRDLARKPHPDVRGWRPVFTKGNSRLLGDAVLWIQSMMNNPRPDYPVEYTPPALGGASQSESSDPNANPDRQGR